MDSTSTGRPLVVRYFAAARAAAGVPEETAPGGGSLDQLAEELAGRHGVRLATVLEMASFLVDGVAWHDRRAPLPPGATVDVLPPFAGG
ncbi:MoaD/ThiS family protein [Plantactinospora soyae]|uniref:Molybdopterin converting factor small subunit n=1 Tax=Plantactinospora soyae TaxID=1544732 RepID=A0A927M3C9_9ACTN|nr:MoaD/ThiS family protein [Plantactinospora soyae]MBE1486041.1 molybdopterin converting factor small subunit [Plantactinospora soyae]